MSPTPFAIGVDLGGTNLRAAAIGATGELLEKHVVPTDSRARGPDEVLAALADAVAALISRHQGGTLVGIGVGVPGILDAKSGVLRDSPSLPGWKEVPVRAVLERRLRTNIVLDNDANAAAMGELWVGAARGETSLCMLTLGTGVGGALVLDGRPWRGKNGMAGELGHMTLWPEGHRCNCGNRGCLEVYGSATAVDREARTHGALARALVDVPLGAGARRVFELALEGSLEESTEAREVFEGMGVSLGIALAGLVNALDAPIYVVGGGVSAAWELFSPALFAELGRRSFVHRATGTRVVRAALPSDAGLFGAARLALLDVDDGAAR